VQELDENNSIKANYIRGLNIDEPLMRIDSSGTIRNYLSDALGSIIALTDDTGVIKTTYTYDAFGNTTISGEGSDNPFQYTGRENDNTGLYYYRFRYYSPHLQRFISEDPSLKPVNNLQFINSVIGNVTGCFNRAFPALMKNPYNLHEYVYTNNNPINLIDPLGLFPNDPIIINPPKDEWPPPAPRNFCETKCYSILFLEYYYCNVGWSTIYLETHDAECARRWSSNCKRKAYEQYKNCMKNCFKK
jgi:RHS repeat-associated protein